MMNAVQSDGILHGVTVLGYGGYKRLRVRRLPQSSICDGSSEFRRDLEKTDAKLFLKDAMLVAQSLAPALQYS